MARGQSVDPTSTRSTTPLARLTFTGPGLDRSADERSEPDLIERVLADPATQVVSLRAGRFPVFEDTVATSGEPSGIAGSDHGGEPAALALVTRPGENADLARLAVFLGRRVPADETGGERAQAGSTAYTAVIGVVEDEEPPAEGVGAVRWRGLRSIAVGLPPEEAAIAATLSALVNWHATHTHCPRCGDATVVASAGWTRRCPRDDSEHFPRTDPAVIMAVVDESDRLLLARGAGFTAAGMSVLAGFVEPGESFAEAVIREVVEEVGIEVVDVTYLGDQPWPFPNGVMIGFSARALTTELRPQDGEIEAARWFTRAEFAAALADGSLQISGRLSIARRLIEHWYGEPLQVPERSLRG